MVKRASNRNRKLIGLGGAFCVVGLGLVSPRSAQGQTSAPEILYTVTPSIDLSGLWGDGNIANEYHFGGDLQWDLIWDGSRFSGTGTRHHRIGRVFGSASGVTAVVNVYSDQKLPDSNGWGLLWSGVSASGRCQAYAKTVPGTTYYARYTLQGEATMRASGTLMYATDFSGLGVGSFSRVWMRSTVMPATGHIFAQYPGVHYTPVANSAASAGTFLAFPHYPASAEVHAEGLLRIELSKTPFMTPQPGDPTSNDPKNPVRCDPNSPG
jgi:hypothetical protein